MFKAGVAVLAAVAVSFGGLLVAPAPPAHAAATTEGLVAWYKLDETSGTVASDSSGNGRTATVDGAAN